MLANSDLTMKRVNHNRNPDVHLPDSVNYNQQGATAVRAAEQMCVHSRKMHVTVLYVCGADGGCALA